jgi:hypothetical protein
MEAGNQRSPVDRKMVIRCLQNINPSHTAHFSCHLSLIVTGTHMADYRIGVDNIEALIAIPRQISCISNDRAERRSHRLWRKV